MKKGGGKNNQMLVFKGRVYLGNYVRCSARKKHKVFYPAAEQKKKIKGWKGLLS